MSSKFAGIGRTKQGKGQEPEQARPVPEIQPVEQPPCTPVAPPVLPRSKPLAKSKDPNYTQACAWIPKSLYGQVKSVVYGEGMEYSEYVEHLIRQDFQRRGLT